MLPKPLPLLALADLEGLIGTSEGRTLEFKREKVGQKEEDRREFLADVSSFANAQGGDLVFGIEESAGIAIAADGIEIMDPDAERLRLENIVRDGLEPRLAVEMQWIEKRPGVGFLVLRARPSFAAPHRVKFRDHAKFYGRNSGGKYSMDVHELRMAFLANSGVEARLTEIQGDTISAVMKSTLPVEMSAGPIIAVNYVPLAALFARIDQPVDGDYAMTPVDVSGFESFPTLDGYLTYSVGGDGHAYSVSITHRGGFTTSVFQAATDSSGALYAGYIEGRLHRATAGARMVLAKQSMPGPAAVCLSLMRVGGCTINLGRPIFRSPPNLKAPVLIFPPLIVDEPTLESLKPLCSRLWNAFGYTRPDDRVVGAEH